MSPRANSSNAREAIVIAARHMFYENGYAGTTYSALAKTLGMSPGSLTYHFSSKSELGTIVHQQYVDEYHKGIRAWLMEHHGFYSPLTVFALGVLIGIKMYGEDERAWRFYREHAQSDFNRTMRCGSKPFFPPYLKETDLAMDESEPELMTAAYQAIATALNIRYFSGELNTSAEFFADYKIKTMLSFARVPGEVIDKTISDCKAYFEEMNIEVLPDFEIVMHG